MDWIFYLRMLNIALSAFVLVLCGMKLVLNDTDKARRARIIALGFFAISAGLGAYELRDQPFSIRIPLVTLGLMFGAYGMMTMSKQPETYKQK